MTAARDCAPHYFHRPSGAMLWGTEPASGLNSASPHAHVAAPVFPGASHAASFLGGVTGVVACAADRTLHMQTRFASLSCDSRRACRRSLLCVATHSISGQGFWHAGCDTTLPDAGPRLRAEEEEDRYQILQMMYPHLTKFGLYYQRTKNIFPKSPLTATF